MHRGHFAVHVEHFGLVHAEGFDDVLVGVGVQGFFEGLAQQVLAALRVGDVAVDGQHQVVGDQRVGAGEKAQRALDDQPLVVRKRRGVLPLGDVGRHVDLVRHPVVGAAGDVLFPGPAVLERHELVEVGLAVDDFLVVDLDTTGAHGDGLGTGGACAFGGSRVHGEGIRVVDGGRGGIIGAGGGAELGLVAVFPIKHV